MRAQASGKTFKTTEFFMIQQLITAVQILRMKVLNICQLKCRAFVLKLGHSGTTRTRRGLSANQIPYLLNYNTLRQIWHLLPNLVHSKITIGTYCLSLTRIWSHISHSLVNSSFLHFHCLNALEHIFKCKLIHQLSNYYLIAILARIKFAKSRCVIASLLLHQFEFELDGNIGDGSKLGDMKNGKEASGGRNAWDEGYMDWFVSTRGQLRLKLRLREHAKKSTISKASANPID